MEFDIPDSLGANWRDLPGVQEFPTFTGDPKPYTPADVQAHDQWFQEYFQRSPRGASVMPMNGRPMPTVFDVSSGWSWLPAAAQAGVGVYNAIWGGDESGKGETVAETSTAEWYTDMPYSSGVPTQRQLGMHSHPHPRGLVHRRRRRRKLLTASDKADIAFITGTLGKGEMGRTAIAALLSRRMS